MDKEVQDFTLKGTIVNSGFVVSNKYITFEMKSSELVRMLKRDGWYVVRQSGSHMIMEHPTKAGQLVCPNHGNHEVGKGLEVNSKMPFLFLRVFLVHALLLSLPVLREYALRKAPRLNKKFSTKSIKIHF